MGRIVLILIAILLIAGGIYFFVAKGNIPNPFQKSTSLGGQIFNKSQNPNSDKIPQTNPFAKINPFKGVYQNPFQ